MPKIKARVQQVGMREGKLVAVIECNERVPKKGEIVTVHWGSTRTHSQNALYWKFLDWCINHGGLKEQGHFSPEALHLDLKTYFLSQKEMSNGQFRAIEEATTTDLGKAEFGEYFDKVDHFIQDFFEISTKAFWDEYAERNE